MDPVHLQPGATFSTPFEDGCVVVTPPDEYGAFTARDSDGVECSYSAQMVTVVRPKSADAPG